MPQSPAPSSLTPCPFCGNKHPAMNTEHDADGFGIFLNVKCRICNAQSGQQYVSTGNDCPQTRAEVREAWNRRAALSAVEALGQQAEPVLGEVWMAFGRLDDGRLIALPEYAAVSEREVGSKIMDAARREGFRGLLAERLNALGWTIRRMSPPALQQQEAGSLPSVPALVPAGQVVAWMWQHEETGRVGFIDQWQVDNGWQAANPRLRLIRPLVFAACAPSPTEPKEVDTSKPHWRCAHGVDSADGRNHG